jgi:hypothetical protein
MTEINSIQRTQRSDTQHFYTSAWKQMSFLKCCVMFNNQGPHNTEHITLLLRMVQCSPYMLVRYMGGQQVQLHSLISTLKRGEWSTSCPCHFTLGNEPLVPKAQEAGWAPESIFMVRRREKSVPAESKTHVIQPAA